MGFCVKREKGNVKLKFQKEEIFKTNFETYFSTFGFFLQIFPLIYLCTYQNNMSVCVSVVLYLSIRYCEKTAPSRTTKII